MAAACMWHGVMTTVIWELDVAAQGKLPGQNTEETPIPFAGCGKGLLHMQFCHTTGQDCTTQPWGTGRGVATRTSAACLLPASLLERVRSRGDGCVARLKDLYITAKGQGYLMQPQPGVSTLLLQGSMIVLYCAHLAEPLGTAVWGHA